MQLRNNQGQWCNRPTDQSDSRRKKRAGTFPGIPVSIKGADLHLHLISDLFLGAKGSVFKGSLSLLLLVMATVSPLFSLIFLSLLSFKLSFIYISLSLQVSSSWLFFPIPAANPVAYFTLLTPPFLPGSHSAVSLLSRRSWRVLTSFFNGCYTCYGEPRHILFSLSPSLYYFHSFFFLIHIIILGSHTLPPG